VADETVLKYSADLSQITAEIDKVNAKLEKLGASLDKTAKKFGGSSPQATMVANAMKQAGAQLDKKIAELEKLNQGFAKGGGSNSSGSTNSNNSTNRDLENRYKRESLKYYRDFSLAFGKTSVGKSSNSFDAFGKDLKDLFKGLGGAGGIFNPQVLASALKIGGGGLAAASGMFAGSRIVGSAAKSTGGAVAAAEGAEGGEAAAVATGATIGGGFLKALLSSPIGMVATGVAALGSTGYLVSKRAAERGRFAHGLDTDPGGISTNELNFGRYNSPDNVAAGMVQGKYDITSPAYLAMKLAGINTQGDPAATARATTVEVAKEMARYIKENPQTALTMAHVRGFQNMGFGDDDLMRLGHAPRDEVQKAADKAAKDASAYNLNNKQVNWNQNNIQFVQEIATTGETLVERFTSLTSVLDGATGTLKPLTDEWKRESEMLDGLLKATSALGDEMRAWAKKNLSGSDPNAPTLDATPMELEAGGGGGFRIPGSGGGASAGIRSRGRGGGDGYGGVNPFTGKSPGTGPSNAKTATAMQAAMDQLKKEGVPTEHLRAAAAMLVGQAMSESSLLPTQSHDHGTGYGIYGARDPPGGRGTMRKSNMLAWLKANGYASDSLEGQTREMAHRAMTDFPSVRRTLIGATPDNMLPNTYGVTKTFESPAITNDRRANVKGAYDKGNVGPVSMNNMSHFQQDKKLALTIHNPAGANYAVAGGQLGSGSGNYG
jgi:hypothetical protein